MNINDIRKEANKHGGTLTADGVGGYEVLAPPHHRWIDAEVQCYVLPMNEIEPEHRQDELQTCLDMISSGIEPFPGELCNRKACRKVLTTRYWNSSTEAFYCPSCAKKINAHNPGLCVKEEQCKSSDTSS